MGVVFVFSDRAAGPAGLVCVQAMVENRFTRKTGADIISAYF